jgi:hypothetical protein
LQSQFELLELIVENRVSSVPHSVDQLDMGNLLVGTSPAIPDPLLPNGYDFSTDSESDYRISEIRDIQQYLGENDLLSDDEGDYRQVEFFALNRI